VTFKSYFLLFHVITMIQNNEEKQKAAKPALTQP
jgi:hypothetical protein